ncbi:MAG: hypothetical protein R3301_11310 [Saprospiraceae bacterium]|nr:hypothetical protein [Saprospiraceae bacterium]
MKRRDAIRNLALAATATMFLPGCSDRPVTGMLVNGRLALDRRHRNYLAAISQAILPIPELPTPPGSPVDLILTMVNDGMPHEEVVSFAEGFDQFKFFVEQNQVRLRKATPEEILAMVENALEDQAAAEPTVLFIDAVRDKSIRFLMTSEHYLTQYLEFEMVPAVYDPCRQVENVRR